MAIQSISSVNPMVFTQGGNLQTTQSQTTQPSFASFLGQALDKAASIGQQTDQLAASYATGGPVSVAQLMISEQQASLAVDMMSQIANRVQESYRTVMNMQL